jgi:hypothetical protein
MSEHNYLGLAFKANLEKNPDLFNVDLKHVEEAAKKFRKEQDVNLKPILGESEHREYKRLRHQHYVLTEDVKNAEINLNNVAGNVQGYEERINTVLTKKKEATAADRLGEERMLEHQLEQLEGELPALQEELKKAQLRNQLATRALREFTGAERLVELKKKLGL